MREEIYEMILKWMDLGLGGFRLDAISHLKKNYQYTNLPPDGPDEYNMAFEYFNNVDGLADILCEMKERTFAPTDALTIGEYDHMGQMCIRDRYRKRKREERKMQVHSVLESLQQGIPVSYTHLDVYKRQKEPRSARRMCTKNRLQRCGTLTTSRA